MDFDSPAAAQKAVSSLKATGVQAQMAKVRPFLVSINVPVPLSVLHALQLKATLVTHVVDTGTAFVHKHIFTECHFSQHFEV